MAKIYTKNTWTDEVLSGVEKYQVKNDSGDVVYSDADISLSTTVITAGTPVNAARMNNIENGLDGVDSRVDGIDSDVASIDARVEDLEDLAVVAVARKRLGATFTPVVFGFVTPHVAGDGKGYLSIPAYMDGWKLHVPHARVITAGTTGTLDIQIYNVTQAHDMLTTKLTVDDGETGSETAATAAVVNAGNATVAAYDLLRVDIDAVQTTAGKGLILHLPFGD
jgi:hypothetical protein